jgi:hypothetical protein
MDECQDLEMKMCNQNSDMTDMVAQLNVSIQTLTAKVNNLKSENRELTVVTRATSKQLDEAHAILQMFVGQIEDQFAQLAQMNERAGILRARYIQLRETLLQAKPDGMKWLSTTNPSRFIALRNVNSHTNGRDNYMVHGLIKQVWADIGNILNIINRSDEIITDRKFFLRAISHTVGKRCSNIKGLSLSNNIGFTNLLCYAIKNGFGVENSTHLELAQVYCIVCRFNSWLNRHGQEQYGLIQESDLKHLLCLQ